MKTLNVFVVFFAVRLWGFVSRGLPALAVLFVLGALGARRALAAGSPTSPTDVVTMTIGALLAWIVSTGIAMAVAFVLAQFPQLPEGARTAISHIANLVLAAFVLAVAQLLPQNVLDMTVFDGLVFGASFVVNWVVTFIGQLMGAKTYVQRVEVRVQVLSARKAMLAQPG